MKFFRNIFVFFVVIFTIVSCQSTPNHMHEPVNSTESGSYADGSYDSNSTKYDTLSPAKPVDTTGEQTGRMNAAPIH